MFYPHSDFFWSSASRIFPLVATPVIVMVMASACSEYELIAPEDRNKEHISACELIEPLLYDPVPTDSCVQEPEIGLFNPVVEWQWSDNPESSSHFRIEVAPIVINLTDDNGDGLVDEADIPDVVFTSFSGNEYKGTGYVMALSGDTGSVLFAEGNPGGYRPLSLSGIAAGDIDADGSPDLFVPTKDGLMRLDQTGAFVWHVDLPTVAGGGSIVSIADLDADGMAELLMHGAAVDHEGHILWEAEDNSSSRYLGSFAVDLDSDGKQEVIAGGTVFNYDGTIRWSDSSIKGIPAVGDLDLDGVPEIVAVTRPDLTVMDIDGNVLWTYEFSENGGGAPTIADFDGDGLAEIGVASKQRYYVFESDGTVLWTHETQETSSGMTGSSVFDFEGDGAAEVVYADERTLWVFDGQTGQVELEWTGHSSGTRYEYPTVVDIDRDGSAEILVGHGRGSDVGLTVLGSESGEWAPARGIWNQFAYSITNVNDDGSIPRMPWPNWLEWNNFRAGNSESKTGLGLPDLRVAEPEVCTDSCELGEAYLFIPVENAGGEPVEQEFTVQLSAMYGDERRERQQVVLSQLDSHSTRWIGPILLSELDFGPDGLVVEVDVVSGAIEGGAIRECLEDNNRWTIPSFPCD